MLHPVLVQHGHCGVQCGTVGDGEAHVVQARAVLVEGVASYRPRPEQLEVLVAGEAFVDDGLLGE